jgi:hypothetical protein
MQLIKEETKDRKVENIFKIIKKVNEHTSSKQSGISEHSFNFLNVSVDNMQMSPTHFPDAKPPYSKFELSMFDELFSF